MKPSAARRMYIVLGVLLTIFVAFAFRSYQLQVVLAAEHIDRGDWNSTSIRRVEAPRGSILDREGRTLAHSVRTETLVIDPQFFFVNEIENRTALLEALSSLEGFSLDQFEEWASTEPGSIPQYSVIQRRLPPAEAEAIIEQLRDNNINSVYTIPEYRRIYPYQELAGHTIGFMQGDGALGLSGIERLEDEVLRGGYVEYEVQRDHARRAYLLGDVPDPDEARGGDVVLTIDMALQQFVEDALAQTVDHYRAESGVVIVSRPETGEILSMASYPQFDPNLASSYPIEASLNPAIAHAYEPGSTIKIFTFASAMEEGHIDFDTEMDIGRGRVFVGGHWVEDTHSEGILPAWEVMQVSSNVGALQMGMMMSQETHRDYLVDFGFGSRPGTGLSGETAGLLRRTPWYEIEHANIAFGHGFSVSPLQLNMATAAIANGGMLMRPMVVRELHDADGNVIESYEPVERGRVISEQVAHETTLALETVVQPGGTGTRAMVPGFRVAGKTGTAELYNPQMRMYENEYLSSFTGFVPSDDPQFAITVMVVRPVRWLGYYGGLVAAPLFREVAIEALQLHGIFPEQLVAEQLAADPFAKPPAPGFEDYVAGDAGDAEEGTAIGGAETVEDPEAFAEGGGALSSQPDTGAVAPPVGITVEVPDLSDQRAFFALEILSELGLEARMTGNGDVVEQSPAPGQRVMPGTVIHLTLGHDG